MRQRVEIIKCLRRDPSILIFDEPTSVLTPAESERLFETLRHVVVEEGRAVALVSHKLDEILRATDEVTIMRQGRVVDQSSPSDVDAATLAAAMVGRSVSLRSERVGLGVVDASLDGTEVPPTPARVGAGRARSWTASACARKDGRIAARRPQPARPCRRDRRRRRRRGQRPAGTRRRTVESARRRRRRGPDRRARRVPTGRAGAMASAGIGVIPEDRHDSGVVLEMSVAENLALRRHLDASQLAASSIVARWESAPTS